MEQRLAPYAGISNKKQSIADPHNDVFFAAVSSTHVPMLVTDPHQPDNPIVFANHAFVSMTGYALDEILGHNCRFLRGPETDPATVDEIRDAIRSVREISTEILNYRKDGSSFWNALFISPVFNERGELVYFFASQLDVSRRRDAEDALHQSQKMEALGQLTGGIAHDFNNLLQVMSGYLDILQLGIDVPGDPASMQVSVDKVRAAVTRSATLTQQLLAFARRQELRGRIINLNAVAASMVEMAKRTLGEEVTLRTEFDPALLNCRVDPTQLESALLNVLLNSRDAMRATPEKTVTVRTANVELGDGQLIGSVNLPAGRYVVICVTDTGAGIPATLLDHVMEPFFTTKEQGKGTGLGLSMVSGFVRQTGGAVSIVSEAARGTTVRLHFPATGDGDSMDRLPAIGAVLYGNNETILIVDDRPEVAEVAREMLEITGYRTRVAIGTDEALAVLRQPGTIDLLFTDMVMPGRMTGVQLAREARRIRPAIRVLLSTGFADTSLERRDLDGSQFNVINKPYRRVDLARKIRMVLSGPTGAG
jgi:PAS domain S-box-containing protein